MSKIIVDLSVDSATNLKTKLTVVKQQLENMIREYCIESLSWIMSKANIELDAATWGYNSSDIRNQWGIEPLASTSSLIRYQLVNYADESVYAEFGTGIVGGSKPHPNANEANYEYDLGGHGTDGWNFYIEETNTYFKGFVGYEGHAFLYKAMQSYMNGRYYITIWKEILNRYLK